MKRRNRRENSKTRRRALLLPGQWRTVNRFYTLPAPHFKCERLPPENRVTRLATSMMPEKKLAAQCATSFFMTCCMDAI